MPAHIDLGKSGENLACTFLQQNGFSILFRNWRHSYYEIDIIAEKDGTLHFVEIKTRKSKKFGEPEDDVTKKKLMRLMEAAEAFQEQYPEWKRIQYDVLAIYIKSEKEIEYFFIEDLSV